MTPVHRCHRTGLIAGALLCSLTGIVHAQEAVCNRVLDSMLKYVNTPNHTYTTQTGSIAGGASSSVETIHAGLNRYLMHAGKWIADPTSTEELLEIEKEKLKSHNRQCRSIRDESVGGDGASLYAVHSETDYGKADTQVWISKRTGLPLKMDIKLRTNGGGESHIASRMEYDHIQPPPALSR